MQSMIVTAYIIKQKQNLLPVELKYPYKAIAWVAKEKTDAAKIALPDYFPQYNKLTKISKREVFDSLQDALFYARGKAILEVVLGALFFFPVIGALTVAAAGWVWYAWSTDERARITYWYAPIGPIRTVVLIGLLLFLLQGLAIFVRNLDIIFGRKEAP